MVSLFKFGLKTSVEKFRCNSSVNMVLVEAAGDWGPVPSVDDILSLAQEDERNPPLWDQSTGVL